MRGVKDDIYKKDEVHTNEKNNRTLPITCLLRLSFTLGLNIGTLGRCVESISHQSLAEKDFDRRCQAVEKLGERCLPSSRRRSAIQPSEGRQKPGTAGRVSHSKTGKE